MLGNDISNRQAPTFAIRVEDFLVKYKEDTIIDKIKNFVVGKEKRAELNPQVLSVINYIFRATDYSVDLVCEKDKFNSKLEELLKDVPYNRMKLIVKPVEISILLYVGECMYYVDDNEERISVISNANCIKLDYLNTILRRK